MALKMLFFFAVASCAAWPLLFAGIGTLREVRQRNERENTRTTGVIVDYVNKVIRTGRSGRIDSWRPIVEYTADGQSYRVEYANSMSRDQFPEGMSVDVLYDVSDPTHFHLADDPVFLTPGKGAIRVAVIWIVASAALTVFLAVFVGGARFDFGGIGRRVQSVFHGRR